DEPAAARRSLDELVHVESLLEALARVRKRSDDLAGFAKSYARHANLRSRVERAYDEVLDDLIGVEVRFAERAEDRRDVFLTVKAIGPGGGEAAELVEKMYASWAERRGVRTTLLRRGADEALWLFEGGALFGLLRAEEGLHRFEGGGKGADRQALYVRVEVAARPDGAAELPRREVRLDRSGSGVTAVHIPSGTRVEIAGPAPNVSDELALELLQAEREARERRRGLEDDRLVRRYGIEGRFVRDEDTGLRT